jgi:hypothetical protein
MLEINIDPIRHLQLRLRGKVSFRGAMLTAAYTNTGSAVIRSPFDGTPGFTSSKLYDFDRANEEAYRISLSQNLA